MNRVVITGMGAITPLGNDVASFWEGLKEGKNGIAPITKFDKKDLDVEGQQIATDLKLIQYDMVAGKGYLSKNFFNHCFFSGVASLLSSYLMNATTLMP